METFLLIGAAFMFALAILLIGLCMFVGFMSKAIKEVI